MRPFATAHRFCASQAGLRTVPGNTKVSASLSTMWKKKILARATGI